MPYTDLVSKTKTGTDTDISFGSIAGLQAHTLIAFPTILLQVGTYLRNWLLAVLGSPTIQTFMSPRREVPSPVVLGTPPNNISKTPRFTSSLPEKKSSREKLQFSGEW